MNNKRGQVTIFIIIALVIIGGIGAYLIIRNNQATGVELPQQYQALEEYYKSCIKEITTEGVMVLGDKGGWINEPPTQTSSALEPLTNKHNFYGQSIPYWYYLVNNQYIQQPPTKEEMQEQLSEYIKVRLDRCDFSIYEQEGYTILRNSPEVRTTINPEEVLVELVEDTTYAYGEETIRITDHDVNINTGIGKLYEKAKEIFTKEMEGMFLEKYAVDAMRLYAPVDGVEITCAPKTWNTQDIRNEIKTALQVNYQEVRLQETGKKLVTEEEKYYTLKEISSEGIQANFHYDPQGITNIEVNGGEEYLLALPVGNQQGLGIIGFCYVTWHNVYDMDMPLMIQLINEQGEIFQYPIQIVIRGNKEREAVRTTEEGTVAEVCQYKNKEITVNTYDSNLNPVEALISYKCINQECQLGKTNNNEGLVTKAPQCYNGYVLARAEGYENAKYPLSTNEENTANVLMEKKYPVRISVTKEGNEIKDKTVITIIPIINTGENSDKETRIIIWPEQKTLTLSEGEYNISAVTYGNNRIVLPESKKTQCYDVPRPGLAGVIGMTKEQCQTITIPGQVLNETIIAGGTSKEYITESQLQTNNPLVIEEETIRAPKSVEELQYAYSLIENTKLTITK